jgi:hypothetical protein
VAGLSLKIPHNQQVAIASTKKYLFIHQVAA